jgi:hypothetical protein
LTQGATDPSGAGASATLKVYPASNYYAVAYLKVPPNVSGNNFQVEATKCKADGTVLDKKVLNLSSVFTTWKRVYVERDKMFRRGGLLYEDAIVNDTSLVLYKNADDTRWDNLSPGDKVSIFDTGTPYEDPHDDAYVGTITDNYGSGTPHQVLVSLVTTSGGSTPYQVCRTYTASPVGSGYMPDFTRGASAGAGVIYSTVSMNGGTITDTSTNQINGIGSAFYDADMRAVERTFVDGDVQVIGQNNGMCAVPFMPQAWFDNPDPFAAPRFSQIWFCNKNPWPSPNQHLNTAQNYFHLVGASSHGGGTGSSYPESDYSYIYRQRIQDGCTGCSAEEIDNCTKETTNHEQAHQFRINSCDSDFHDSNMAWCGNFGGACVNPTLGYEYCIMHGYDTHYWTMRGDGIFYFDCDDLAGTGPECGIPDCSMGTSIRTDINPE